MASSTVRSPADSIEPSRLLGSSQTIRARVLVPLDIRWLPFRLHARLQAAQATKYRSLQARQATGSFRYSRRVNSYVLYSARSTCARLLVFTHFADYLSEYQRAAIRPRTQSWGCDSRLPHAETLLFVFRRELLSLRPSPGPTWAAFHFANHVNRASTGSRISAFLTLTSRFETRSKSARSSGVQRWTQQRRRDHSGLKRIILRVDTIEQGQLGGKHSNDLVDVHISFVAVLVQRPGCTSPCDVKSLPDRATSRVARISVPAHARGTHRKPGHTEFPQPQGDRMLHRGRTALRGIHSEIPLLDTVRPTKTPVFPPQRPSMTVNLPYLVAHLTGRHPAQHFEHGSLGHSSS